MSRVINFGKHFESVVSESGVSEDRLLEFMRMWGCFERHPVSHFMFDDWFLEFGFGKRLENHGTLNFKLTKKGKKWLLNKLSSEMLIGGSDD